MKDRREINIEVFEDTMKHYKSNPTLKAAVSNSVANQRFTAADEDEELAQLLTSRIRRIFEIAAANGNEALILGAFGCGAFKNPPIVVAKVFAEQLQAFRGCFKAIEFAVFHTERETGNYNAFKAAIR